MRSRGIYSCARQCHLRCDFDSVRHKLESEEKSETESRNEGVSKKKRISTAENIYRHWEQLIERGKRSKRHQVKYNFKITNFSHLFLNRKLTARSAFFKTHSIRLIIYEFTIFDIATAQHRREYLLFLLIYNIINKITHCTWWERGNRLSAVCFIFVRYSGYARRWAWIKVTAEILRRRLCDGRWIIVAGIITVSLWQDGILIVRCLVGVARVLW